MGQHCRARCCPPLTDAQKSELDHHLADYETNPDDVASWSQAKADALLRAKR